MLDKPTSWRRWSTADREPVAKWGTKRITLVGDAAHPVAQYMAQGACMALEDAVTLGKALAQCEGDAAQTFALYESVRIPRTARIVWSTREMGRVYHAAGVERARCVNLLWKGKSQVDFLSEYGVAVRLERRQLSATKIIRRMNSLNTMEPVHRFV